VSASKMHRLHQVKLFFPAICHITHGSKVIVQDDNRLVATGMNSSLSLPIRQWRSSISLQTVCFTRTC
jgi:hypothetical protein